MKRWKTGVLIAASAFLTCSAAAQDGSTFKGSCGGVFDLCGFVDKANGREAIPALYDRVFEFSDGLAAVRFKGLYGYINPAGEMVIEPQFDLGGEFHFGLAEVVVGNHTGIIDRSGKIVLEPIYKRAIPVTSGAAVVVLGEYRSGYYEGSEQLESDPNWASHGEKGLYEIGAGWIVQPDWSNQFSLFDPKGRGLIWMSPTDGPDERFGLLRMSDGSWKIEPTYEHVWVLNEERVAVRLEAYVGDPGGSDVLDENGDLVFHSQYANIHGWEFGYAQVFANDLYGLMDRNGILLGGRLFDGVREATADRPPQVEVGGKWHEVSADGTLIDVPAEHVVVYPPQPEFKVSPPPTPLSCGRTGSEVFHILSDSGDRLYGLRYLDGRTIIEPKYPALSCYRDGVAWAAIADEGHWCPIGPDEERAAKPDCKVMDHATSIPSHHGPQRLDADDFQSSLKWMRQLLAYCEDGSAVAPLLVGDGVQGHGEMKAACWGEIPF
jgi:hypothetical protein